MKTGFRSLYVFDLKHLDSLSPSSAFTFIEKEAFFTSLPLVVDEKKWAFFIGYDHVKLVTTNSGLKKEWIFSPRKNNNETFLPPLFDIHGRVYIITSHGRVFGIQPDAIPRNTKTQFDCSNPAVFYKFDLNDHGLKDLFIPILNAEMDSHGRIFMIGPESFLLCLEPTL